MSTTVDLMGLGMPPALAARLGYNPATLAGVGTTQTGAAVVSSALTLLTTTSGQVAFILNSAISTGRPVFLWNTGTTYSATVYPPSGGSINGLATNAGFILPPLTGGIFQLTNGSGVSAENWYAITSGTDLSVPIPQQVYNAVSTAPTANNLNLTGANITGGSSLVVLNLTAALSAGATNTLPTVAATVTALQTAGMNPVSGCSYELDIYNSSSGNFSWTTTTNTGWTLNGTQTIAQNTYRRYIVSFQSLAAATLQSLGQFAIGSGI